MTRDTAWRAWLWAQHDYARAMRWIKLDRDPDYLPHLFRLRLLQSTVDLLPTWTPGGQDWRRT